MSSKLESGMVFSPVTAEQFVIEFSDAVSTVKQDDYWKGSRVAEYEHYDDNGHPTCKEFPMYTLFTSAEARGTRCVVDALCKLSSDQRMKLAKNLRTIAHHFIMCEKTFSERAAGDLDMSLVDCPEPSQNMDHPWWRARMVYEWQVAQSLALYGK